MADDPTRIQLRRTKGWRKPEGCIVVARPSKWGNPYRVTESMWQRKRWNVWDERTGLLVAGSGSSTKRDAVAFAVAEFRLRAIPADLSPLRGRDLACWCPLDQPCHADVLLEIANA